MKVNGETLRLQIWDTAGQERFRTVVVSHFRKAVVGVVVFDVNESPEAIAEGTAYWGGIIQQHCPDAAIIFVGNKIDTREPGWDRSSISVPAVADYGGGSVEWVSALTGEGVKEMFRRVAQEASKSSNTVRVPRDPHEDLTNTIDLG